MEKPLNPVYCLYPHCNLLPVFPIHFCSFFQSSVDELQSHFIAYEQIQEQVEHILQHWDLDQGLLLVPLPSEETLPVPEDASAEKQVS